MGRIRRLHYRQVVPVGLDAAWTFFSDPNNLEAMTPPDLRFRILWGADEAMHAGQMIAYRIGILPLVSLTWLTEITMVDPGRAFVDEQRQGPYALWHHLHRFEPHTDGTLIEDRVTYQLHGGPIGDLVHACWVGPQLQKIFAHRRAFLERWVADAEVVNDRRTTTAVAIA